MQGVRQVLERQRSRVSDKTEEDEDVTSAASDSPEHRSVTVSRSHLEYFCYICGIYVNPIAIKSTLTANIFHVTGCGNGRRRQVASRRRPRRKTILKRHLAVRLVT